MPNCDFSSTTRLACGVGVDDAVVVGFGLDIVDADAPYPLPDVLSLRCGQRSVVLGIARIATRAHGVIATFSTPSR